MCGISGIISSRDLNKNDAIRVSESIKKLEKRGPDASGIEELKNAILGHTRLSIIDTSSNANQPFWDKNKRYCIVFNGEVFNYLSIKKELEKEGVTFRTNSDTEVVLESFIRYGSSFLNKLNGFFALVIYDSIEKNTLVARDRFGIKPFNYYKTNQDFYFSSELKGLLEFQIPREIDTSSLYTYLQLNYIPEPHSILKDVKKLTPGHYLIISKDNKVQKIPYYQLKYPIKQSEYLKISYKDAQNKFLELLDQSIEKRMVSDVPLGTFLSGGIDSSLITAIASRKTKKLSTFSIGFADEPLFDETKFALLVAKKFNTNHHVFSLSNNDLLESLYETLEYIDEPFADSSALAVNALSKRTRKKVTVALSGDGADELFAGYHKHMGEFLMRQNGTKQKFVKGLSPVWEMLPKSRNSKLGNLVRKFNKFAEGSKLSTSDRYWLWASLMNEANASNLLIKKAKPEVYLNRKSQHLSFLNASSDFNDVLMTDLNIVLKSDMLRKVDLMSMANSLEVRTPFLDHELVDFAFSLDSSFKINQTMKKRLIQDASKKILPDELYNRPKQGFEVPLLNWFKTDLFELIHNDLLSEKFIREQNLFNYTAVKELKAKLKSSNPSDSQGTIWAILVFNHWWKKYLS